MEQIAEWLGLSAGIMLGARVGAVLWRARKKIAGAVRGWLREGVASDPRRGNGSIHEGLDDIKKSVQSLTVQTAANSQVLADHGTRLTDGLRKMDALHGRVDAVAQAFAVHLKETEPLAKAMQEIIEERTTAVPERGLGRLVPRERTTPEDKEGNE